jgi:glycerophosphoryl diester phosphodiesterase
MREIPIRGDTIRLGQLLKLAGVVGSGAEAKALLADDEAQPVVNGEPESRRGRQLHNGDVVAVAGEILQIAGDPLTSGGPMAIGEPADAAGDASPRGPLVIAHRGAWDPAPQNSIAAFERAVELGADGFELDVRRTADGRLVVIHDQRLGVTPVARLTAEVLRERLAPGQAPDLDDVLAALSPRRALVDVELKEDGYVGEAMAVVARHLAPDRYVVTSFLDPVLPQVRAAVPEARTGLLLAARRPARTLERRVEQTRPDFLALHTTLARTGLLEFAARRRLPAWVWTVNEPRLLRTLLADPRVEAVITDRARDTVAVARIRRAPPGPAVRPTPPRPGPGAR